MAGDYHFSPEAEERRAKAKESVKESSKKYNESAFTPDSKAPASLVATATFESIYENLCYSIATMAAGKLAKPLTSKVTKPLKVKIRKLIKDTLGNYAGKSTEASDYYIEQFIKLSEDLIDGKISEEEYVSKAQKNGEIANKYFIDKGSKDYVNKALNAESPKVEKNATKNYVKSAVQSANGDKLTLMSNVIEGVDPSYTANHLQNVGSMLEKYIDDPRVAKWLENSRYDVKKLRKVARKIGKSHDFGKNLVRLEDVNNSGNDELLKGRIRAHEGKGRDLAEKMLSSEEDTIPGGIGETYSGLMNDHGIEKAENNTPLTQLLAMIDQMEAAQSPRSYKTAKSASHPGNFSVSVIKGTDKKVHYDFPDDVRKALLDNYDKFFVESLEENYGADIAKKWYSLSDAEKVKAIENTPLSNLYKKANIDYIKRNEMFRKGANKALDIPEKTPLVLKSMVAQHLLKKGVDEKEKKPSVSDIRTEAYNKYKGAYKDGIGKNKRKAMGFFLSTIGIDPATIGSKMINYGDPEELKKSLTDFNTKFQSSDQDASKKDAVKYITDNWDSLSDADKAYFKHRIETDNKDFINQK